MATAADNSPGEGAPDERQEHTPRSPICAGVFEEFCWQRLRAVMSTYTTRHVFLWFPLIWLFVLGIICLLVIKFGKHPTPDAIAAICAFPPVILNFHWGALLIEQLQFQFANPRARLLPGFAAAHFLVAAIIVAVTVVVPTVTLALPSGGSVWGVAGIALAAIAFGGWCFYRDDRGVMWWHNVLWILVILLWLGHWVSRDLVGDYLKGPVQSIVVDGNGALSLLVWCVGLAGAAGLGRRLWMSCQEMPLYSFRAAGLISNRLTWAERNARRRWEEQRFRHAPKQGRFRDLQFHLVIGRTGVAGPLRRMLLRQVTRGFTGVFGAVLTFVVVLTILSLSTFDPTSDRTAVFVPKLMLWWIVCPSAMVLLIGSWLQQWPHLARESLYPLNRKELVRGLLATNACDAAILSLGYYGAIFVASLLPHAAESQAGLVLPDLAATLPVFLVTCCSTPWVASFRSLWAVVPGMLLVGACALAVARLAATATARFWWPVSLASVTVMTATAVAGIYWITFRRWCRLDLD